VKGRARLALVGLTVAGVLISTSSGASTGLAHPVLTEAISSVSRITDRLELAKTRVVAGSSIKGQLVIENPGSAINLSDGCRPSVRVVLGNASYQQQVAFPLSCDGRPFFIAHGTTRIPVTVFTTYFSCADPATEEQVLPPALPPATLPAWVGNVPPGLAAGKYHTSVVWDGAVPIPLPKSVTVTVS
jgi:hypothetical protein